MTANGTSAIATLAAPAAGVAQSPAHASPSGREPLRVLMIAFHFPPIAAAGTHRTLNFVQRLGERGNRIGVVTASALRGFRLEQALCERVPSSVQVARAWHVDPFLFLHRLRGQRSEPAEPHPGGPAAGPAEAPGSSSAEMRGTLATTLDYVSRLADVPDRYASWIVPAFLAGVSLAKQIDAQVVYATAPPFSANLAALLLSEVLGLPLVVDLRDPWAVNPFRTVPFRSLRHLDEALESLVIRRARRVILNTPLAESEYVERYGDSGRFITIQNGIAPDLLLLPRGEPAPGPGIRLLHVGSIYGRRSPLPLVRAMRRLKDADPVLARRIRVEQIGPVDDGGRLIAALREHGMADRFELKPSVSHREAFLECTRAHALLLLGVSGERPEVQVPAKLFEYLAARRPILALAKPGGAILTTLASAGAACVGADPDDEDKILAALMELAQRLDRGGSMASASADAFRYENLALALERVLREATGGGRDA